DPEVAPLPLVVLRSLSRLNHWLSGGETHPEIVQRTVEGHHEIADTLLLQAHPIFDDAAALDTTVDMLDPQPRWWMELLVSYVLLPHERLPQIVINSRGGVLSTRPGSQPIRWSVRFGNTPP